MPGLKRLALLFGAITSISSAFIVINWVGLPARAEFTGFTATNGRRVAPEVNAYAPPFALKTLDGTTLNLGSFRGYPILINFWATWCEPCRNEMPSLQGVYEAYKDRGLRIVAVNIGETSETARIWIQQMKITFDIVLDPTAKIASLYQLRGQPSTYVVSPSGIISQIFFGPITESALETALAPYFSNGYTIEK
jgi:peroxiredoxin